jgi:hypothetical protein
VNGRIALQLSQGRFMNASAESYYGVQVNARAWSEL